MYDPISDRLTEKATIPKIPVEHVMYAYEDRIMVVDINASELQCYDPKKDHWSAIESLPNMQPASTIDYYAISAVNHLSFDGPILYFLADDSDNEGFYNLIEYCLKTKTVKSKSCIFRAIECIPVCIFVMPKSLAKQKICS